jgi:hypothetical protein
MTFSRRTAVAVSLVLLAAASLSVAQHPPIDAKVTLNKAVAGPIDFSNPAIRMRGTIEASAGNRLYIVEIAVGASDVAGELSAFPLVVDGGREFVAIAAGGGSDLLFPIDKLALGNEMTQILKVEGIIAVTRNSATSVVVETTPKATLALLYEIPETATAIAIRLPDGSVRSLR